RRVVGLDPTCIPPAPSPLRPEYNRGSRGRPVRWAACDEVRPGSVPHAASHSTRAREAGPLGGWPATRCDPAPFLMPLSFHPGSRGRPARWAAPPTHDRPQLDGVRVADDLVGRDQLVAADHEDRLREDVELTQDLLHATPT